MVQIAAGPRCRIHRGCHEIGGNCVELEFQGSRIVLDVGLPLENDDHSLPQISVFTNDEASLSAVFVSHPHPDHYGLVHQISSQVPVYIGWAAKRIISVSDFFTPLPSLGGCNLRTYVDRTPVNVGPFAVTPILVDHSAYDSYSFLIECAGKRIFYSGDIRAHGRKAHLFREFVRNPPRNIDVLICEGTQLGREPNFRFPTEATVSQGMLTQFQQASGMGLVWCSGQNVDRIASVHEAAKAAGRHLIIDMYTAEVLRATGDELLPQPGSDVSIYLPRSQKSRIMREKAFHIAKPYYPFRIYPEQLKAQSADSVMIIRPSMLRELIDAECLSGAVFISSVWGGYLSEEAQFLNKLSAQGIEHHHIHTSGHATPDQLSTFVQSFDGSRVVPIHLNDRKAFAMLSVNTELREDLEWWEV